MRLSHPKVEGHLQASKWLSHRVLLDTREMVSLFNALPSFLIYNVSELVALQDARILTEDFLAKYIDYITSLKAGLLPDEKVIKPYFSSAFSAKSDPFYAMEVKEGKYIIKAKEPVVQLSLHHFTFSEEQMAFHSMVHSKHSITWGIQFAYPQLYSNSITNDVIEVYKNPDFPNTELFKTLAKWIRGNTTPAPFMVGETPLNATFRLGKRCQSWIHEHSQLAIAGLTV